MDKLCIFAGTTEGRALAGALRGTYRVTACVATEYGRETLSGMEGIRIRAGRMDEAEMETFFRENGFSRVLDATHPYAREVTENIRAACERTGTPLWRVLRDTGAGGGAVTVSSVGEAAEFLAGTEGRILLTTGSKELSAFAGLDPSRVWARVLPLSASLTACAEAGLPASHVIAMQGPFSREMNAATLREIGARWLVTKSSGSAGGFQEKLDGARDAGAAVIAVGPPPESGGVTVEEALRALLPPVRRVTLVGIGPGGEDLPTREAARALECADALIGAKSVLDCVEGVAPEALEDLPSPTHVFLGGSSGNLREIPEAILRKNPAAHIVATAVTPEAQAELTACARELGFTLFEAVTVSVSRSGQAGRDPVTVFTVQGGENGWLNC